ncbi:hypothetical protein HPP92_028610, partial [Vanilla planifolia]
RILDISGEFDNVVAVVLENYHSAHRVSEILQDGDLGTGNKWVQKKFAKLKVTCLPTLE